MLFSPNRYHCALAAAIVTSLVAATAHAASIGVNFIGANNGGGASVTSDAGVVDQSNWNNESGGTGSTSTILMSDGTSAGSSLSWSSNNAWATGHAGTDQNGALLQGYIDDVSTGTTNISMTNLPASIAGTGATAYSVYLYIVGDTAGRGGTYTVNGQTATLVNSGPEADGLFKLATPATDTTGTGAVEGNYYVFTNVTGTTLSISTTPTVGGMLARSPIDGFQVVSGSPTPEPASLALLSAAELPLLKRRRRA